MSARGRAATAWGCLISSITEANYQLLRDAIVQKRPVACVYQGLKRECCPHILGTSAGAPCVLMFQYGGESSQGLRRGGEWRCMAVAGLSALCIRSGAWRSAPVLSDKQSCVKLVEIEVEPGE